VVVFAGPRVRASTSEPASSTRPAVIQTASRRLRGGRRCGGRAGAGRGVSPRGSPGRARIREGRCVVVTTRSPDPLRGAAIERGELVGQLSGGPGRANAGLARGERDHEIALVRDRVEGGGDRVA